MGRKIVKRRIKRTMIGSSSPTVLWTIVESSKEESGPFLDSFSMIPSHIKGEKSLTRSIADGYFVGDKKPSSKIFSCITPSLSWHNEETKLSPLSKPTAAFIRILLKMLSSLAI